MMKDGHPYEGEGSLYMTDCSEDIQTAVYDWIRDNLIPRKTVNRCHSSYGLKHMLERDTRIYLTNNQFKDAMLHCGFKPIDPEALNWYFGISAKSPAFQHEHLY